MPARGAVKLYKCTIRKKRCGRCAPALRASGLKAVARTKAAVNSCRSKPACNGLSAFSEEHRREYQAQSPCRALMQYTAKSDNHYVPEIWKNPFSKHRLFFPNVSFFPIKHFSSPFAFHEGDYFQNRWANLLEPNDFLFYCEKIESSVKYQ